LKEEPPLPKRKKWKRKKDGDEGNIDERLEMKHE